jgi:hypothetical protein
MRSRDRCGGPLDWRSVRRLAGVGHAGPPAGPVQDLALAKYTVSCRAEQPAGMPGALLRRVSPAASFRPVSLTMLIDICLHTFLRFNAGSEGVRVASALTVSRRHPFERPSLTVRWDSVAPGSDCMPNMSRWHACRASRLTTSSAEAKKALTRRSPSGALMYLPSRCFHSLTALAWAGDRC